MDSSALSTMLRNCLLFSDIEDDLIDVVAENLLPFEVKRGDPIGVEGELAEDVFFVQSGAVEIVKFRPEIQQISRVTVLRAGAHFSEFSVLTRTNKSASAFALEDSLLYRISGEAFLNILEQAPAVGHRLVQTLAELIHQSAASMTFEYFDPLSIAYSSEIPTLLPMALWKKFGVLPLSHHAGLLLVASKNAHEPGFIEHCSSALKNLRISLVMINEADFDQTLRHLTKLYSGPARVEKPAESPQSQTVDVATCLKASPYFQGADESALPQLAQLFESIELKAGETVFRPTEASAYFYIVQSGQIEVSRPSQNNKAWTGLRMRSTGDGLGEISLLLGHPHSTFARATLTSQILRMPKDTFLQLLTSGPFCRNLGKILALRLRTYTELATLKFYDGEKPEQLAELSKLVPRDLLLQHQVIPLRLVDKEITLGVVHSENEAIYSIVLRYLRGYRINLELITREKFDAWMANVNMATVANKVVPLRKTGEGAVFELNKLILDGFETRASDLHLEPTGTGYCVRYRIDGVLTEMASKVPLDVGHELVNRIKVVSELDISNRITPQDGQLKIKDHNTEYTARVATIPTKLGEGAVLRLIRTRNGTVPLQVLAPDSRTVRTFKAISRSKQGLFLVTGPTGSGKTTTLYSLISEINRVDIKIISLEDPVELEIPGVSQIEINERTGLTFERALKSTLRLDPDVLIVGEIRDAESAKSVFEAALSGHLVISTLHTTNSFAVMSRLKELQVPLGTMASGLIGAMAQRLVRKICNKCRAQRPTTDSEKRMIEAHLPNADMPDMMWEGKGCVVCLYAGFHGRLPIMEVWQKNRTIEEMIATDADFEALLTAARPGGFNTLTEFGIKMAINGLTTIDEVDKMTAGGW